MTRIQRYKGVKYLDAVGSVHQRRSHSPLAYATKRTAHVQIDEINLALRASVRDNVRQYSKVRQCCRPQHAPGRR